MSTFGYFALTIAILWILPILFLGIAYLKIWSRERKMRLAYDVPCQEESIWQYKSIQIASDRIVAPHEEIVSMHQVENRGSGHTSENVLFARLTHLRNTSASSRFPRFRDVAETSLPIYDEAGRRLSSRVRLFLN